MTLNPSPPHLRRRRRLSPAAARRNGPGRPLGPPPSPGVDRRPHLPKRRAGRRPCPAAISGGDTATCFSACSTRPGALTGAGASGRDIRQKCRAGWCPAARAALASGRARAPPPARAGIGPCPQHSPGREPRLGRKRVAGRAGLRWPGL